MIQWVIVTGKKDYNKDEVNVVKITQLRVQTIIKCVTMVIYHCLIGKI